MSAENADMILNACKRALAWAKTRDYTGWEKHDALNSRMLQAAFGWGKWPRIIAIQTVMRSPVNLRWVLGVKPHRNPKGTALFARAHLNLYSITGNNEYLDEAKALLDWLLKNHSSGFRGLSWGYPYPWQDPGFFAPSGFPNRIVTYFVGRAMIHAFEVTEDRKYLHGAHQAVQFILSEPTVLYEEKGMKCLSYVPAPDIAMAVMDVPALCAALVAMVGKHTERVDLMDDAYLLMNWVVDKQTDHGAWYYTYPPGDSHITHDNYHTGEIVDSILEYELYSGDTRFADAYRSGLEYYRKHLFTKRGRPKWMNNRQYPYDIHGFSQGIITFSLAGDPDFAESIAKASLEDMWNKKDGRFYYQKNRYWTNTYSPMRWAQAWMTYALSCYLTKLNERV